MPLLTFGRSKPPHPPAAGSTKFLEPALGERRHSATMDLFHHKDGKEKRRSIAERSSSSNKNSPKLTPVKPAKLEIDMESPPLVFYGNNEQSTGALLSGQLLLTVAHDEVKLQNFEMRLTMKVTTKRPVSKDCPDCQSTTTEIRRWIFLREPARFPKGTHTFPFSHLLPGKQPATVDGHLGSVEYALNASATTSLAEPLAVTRVLNLCRALIPGPDRNPVRIFPPTNLSINATLPTAIYLIGEFPVSLRVSGVSTREEDHLRRWNIRQMSWTLEENSSITSPACAKHAHKVGGEGKGVLHEHSRIIGSAEFKTGFKCDFDTPGGLIELEFPISIKPSSHALCDMDSDAALTVTHVLVVELIVAEELVPYRRPKGVIMTGIARVLRMRFGMAVTERSGLGISWDEEQPPIYSDVPASPPGYAQMDDYVGEEIPIGDLELGGH